ncbi:thiol-disulfide oxidoreductase DCC family protein [soil metagenome]
MSEASSIILFDGVCNLCAWSVRFIIERDAAKRFQFASLQSGTGQHLLTKHGISRDRMDSVVLIKDGQAYTESTAALRVARQLSGLWPCLSIGIILPRFIRDPFYRFIAKNRYRWFGKMESCLMPSPELKSRFIDC